MSGPLHKKSKFFVKTGLFNKVSSFRNLEKKIEKLKAENEKAENLLRGDALKYLLRLF